MLTQKDKDQCVLSDLKCISKGESFPPLGIKKRNADYGYRGRQYSGEYGYNKRLVVKRKDVLQEIPYIMLEVNYFKLLTDKMVSLAMNNDVIIKVGDRYTNELANRIIEKYSVTQSFRSIIHNSIMYGGAAYKVYKYGVSVFNPKNLIKIVDKHNIDKVKYYVTYEFLGSNKNFVRFDVYTDTHVLSFVREYKNGVLGSSVDFDWNGETIDKEGKWYETGTKLIGCTKINCTTNDVYGTSLYSDIESLVYGIERRLTINQHLLDNSQDPFLVVGMDMVDTDPVSGKRELKLVDGKYMVSSGDTDVKSVELGYNLENSDKMIDLLRGFLYEISEMGRTFLSGEYSGNISEESLNNIIKSSIDKASRIVESMYKDFVDIVYSILILNDIDINIDDITVLFNIGRTDDDKTIADVCSTFVNNKILSKAYVREKYLGLNQEQSNVEENRIKEEQGGYSNED